MSDEMKFFLVNYSLQMTCARHVHVHAWVGVRVARKAMSTGSLWVKTTYARRAESGGNKILKTLLGKELIVSHHPRGERLEGESGLTNG